MSPDRAEKKLIPPEYIERYDGHYGIAGDMFRRDELLALGLELCERCDGTGNELFSMYRRCSDCHGEGTKSEA